MTQMILSHIAFATDFFLIPNIFFFHSTSPSSNSVMLTLTYYQMTWRKWKWIECKKRKRRNFQFNHFAHWFRMDSLTLAKEFTLQSEQLNDIVCVSMCSMQSNRFAFNLRERERERVSNEMTDKIGTTAKTA